MPELLLEVGCEELPAAFVEDAANDLRHALAESLGRAGVRRSEGVAMGTPRRLIVSFPELDARQEDATKEQRGPALRAAYDASDNPTPALQGFCRSQGIEPEGLRKDDQYVWATRAIPGQPTSTLLADLIPAAIRGLTFAKTMRWGSSRMRFARPIRWILAAFDGTAVDFEIEGVRAGLSSFGHRFYAPESFTAAGLDALVDGLRQRRVEPDAGRRREMIVSQALEVAGGSALLTEALVDENAYLTEWPSALQGEFRPEFQVLPEPVLITAMAKHEKMFPVRDESGRLTNHFVFVRNSGEDETVRRGAEWVLNARFNDAKFFFDEDAKQSLDAFLEKTNGIVFQEKLGTVRARADRLSALAGTVAQASGGDAAMIEWARMAGRYAKADLASGLVSELASLQGIVGGEYARREGFPAAVCAAIAGQYRTVAEAAQVVAEAGPLVAEAAQVVAEPGPLVAEAAQVVAEAAQVVAGAARPRSAPAPDSKRGVALSLIVADALDKLAGYLGLGLEPSGSSDPYGLRRAATTLIEAAWAWEGSRPHYEDLLLVALSEYEKQGLSLNAAKALPAFHDVFASRYSALLPDVRHDLLKAAVLESIPTELTQPRAVLFRARCLEKLADDAAFIQTATRPMNIVIAARRKGIEFGDEDPLNRLEHAALESKEGLDLLELLSASEAPLRLVREEEDAEEAIRLLKDLEGPINRFFETTMVMDDQPDVRYARLTLMHACSLALLTAGDFTQVENSGVGG